MPLAGFSSDPGRPNLPHDPSNHRDPATTVTPAPTVIVATVAAPATATMAPSAPTGLVRVVVTTEAKPEDVLDPHVVSHLSRALPLTIAISDLIGQHEASQPTR